MSSPIYTPEEFEAFAMLQRQAEVRLRERKKHFGIPDIEIEPTQDDVILFRLPAPERVSEGGLHLPDFEINNLKEHDEVATQLGEDRYVASKMIVNNGVLLAAGLGASDWLLSHGYFVGDFVKFRRFAGYEQRAHHFTLRTNVKPHEMKDVMDAPYRDLCGTFDLYDRLNGKDPVLEKHLVTDAGGNFMHVYKPILRSKRS